MSFHGIASTTDFVMWKARRCVLHLITGRLATLQYKANRILTYDSVCWLEVLMKGTFAATSQIIGPSAETQACRELGRLVVVSVMWSRSLSVLERRADQYHRPVLSLSGLQSVTLTIPNDDHSNGLRVFDR